MALDSFRERGNVWVSHGDRSKSKERFQSFPSEGFGAGGGNLAILTQTYEVLRKVETQAEGILTAPTTLFYATAFPWYEIMGKFRELWSE